MKGGAVNVIFSVTIRAIAHPLNRVLQLDYSGAERLPKTDDSFQDSYGRDPSNVTLLGADTIYHAEQTNLENRPWVCTVTLMVAVVSGLTRTPAQRVFSTGRRAKLQDEFLPLVCLQGELTWLEASIHCSRVLATFEPGRTPEVSHLIPQRMVVLPSFGPTKISQHEQMALRVSQASR